MDPPPSQSHRLSSEFEMVGQEDLPDFPTPIVVTDRRGKAKWTVSIPADYDFPLAAREYADICSKCHEVAERVNALHRSRIGGDQLLFPHGQEEEHFVDVHEAEDAGYLPGSVSIGALLSQQRDDGDLIGENKNGLVDRPVCASTMTFVLASEDAGLGRTLMLLWMAYATAQNEGRSFFIDDTRWAYGKYTNIFEAPPLPGCRPPLRHEMLPCPRRARHLVVSAETAREILQGTPAESGGPSSSSQASQRALFQLAHQGYVALFHLTKGDADYVKIRLAELKDKTKIPRRTASAGDTTTTTEAHGVVVGLHVRRGDRHPREFQYRDSYIPTNVYAERAREVLNRTARARGAAVDAELARGHALTVLASDDPMVYESDDLAGGARAQEQIRLAAKASLQQPAAADRAALHKFVDETFGWEGGFFAAMFFNLGRSTLSAAQAAEASAASSSSAVATLAPSAETLRLRSLVGRAYMLDLAVLAGASDAVVCTVSAVGCRLLAVMMGWEKAFDRRGWVNIDGDFGWSGVDL